MEANNEPTAQLLQATMLWVNQCLNESDKIRGKKEGQKIWEGKGNETMIQQIKINIHMLYKSEITFSRVTIHTYVDYKILNYLEYKAMNVK